MKDAIAAAFKWCAGFFSERQPDSSSTRLIMLVGFNVPLVIWAGLTIYHMHMQSFPESVIAVMCAALGLKGIDKYIASKAVVAQIEKDKPPAPEPTPPTTTNVGVVQVGATDANPSS